MAELTKKQAQGQIAEILKDIKAKFAEAKKIADEYQIGFRFDGPDDTGTRGMGGNYSPRFPGQNSERWDNDNEGWDSSSASC